MARECAHIPDPAQAVRAVAVEQADQAKQALKGGRRTTAVKWKSMAGDRMTAQVETIFSSGKARHSATTIAGLHGGAFYMPVLFLNATLPRICAAVFAVAALMIFGTSCLGT
jgi:hypothetical protein